jgi:hypothetical protein
LTSARRVVLASGRSPIPCGVMSLSAGHAHGHAHGQAPGSFRTVSLTRSQQEAPASPTLSSSSTLTRSSDSRSSTPQRAELVQVKSSFIADRTSARCANLPLSLGTVFACVCARPRAYWPGPLGGDILIARPSKCLSARARPSGVLSLREAVSAEQAFFVRPRASRGPIKVVVKRQRRQFRPGYYCC